MAAGGGRPRWGVDMSRGDDLLTSRGSGCRDELCGCDVTARGKCAVDGGVGGE